MSIISTPNKTKITRISIWTESKETAPLNTKIKHIFPRKISLKP